MSSETIQKNHQALVDKIIQFVERHTPNADERGLVEFIQQYYSGVPTEDLLERSLEDLGCALLSHWRFAQVRAPETAKVRVFNPDIEQHGWQSKYTIIEILYDDMPFIVDSLRMAMNREEVTTHLMIHVGGVKVSRDVKGEILQVHPPQAKIKTSVTSETYLYIEVDKQLESSDHYRIEQSIQGVINDIKQMVVDWQPMRERVFQSLQILEQQSEHQHNKVYAETITLLRWLVANHFTFMGYIEYQRCDTNPTLFTCKNNARLGILAGDNLQALNFNLSDLPSAAQSLFHDDGVMLLCKSNMQSRIHRPVYLDCLYITLIDAQGNLNGLIKFVGLFTSLAYGTRIEDIPQVRMKVKDILNNVGFSTKSHNYKALRNIIQTLPRDELFYASVKDLEAITVGILHLQERQKIRLFLRQDVFGYYYSCLVFVPREYFTSNLRQTMQQILMHELQGVEVEFSTRFSESVLARIHFVIRTQPPQALVVDVDAIEDKLIQCARTWRDDFSDALLDYYGEVKQNALLKAYGDAFPISYQESFSARSAVADVQYIEALLQTPSPEITMSLYRPVEEAGVLRFKVFMPDKPLSLSEVVPMLENLGLRIESERAYCIKLDRSVSVWMNDYRMVYPNSDSLDLETVKENFQAAFAAICFGKAENDGFNKLVLAANFTWRQISVLRAYYRYLWQVGLNYPQSNVEETLCLHKDISIILFEVFKYKFHPDETTDPVKIKDAKLQIEEQLKSVPSLSQDRTIRYLLQAILATVRTNYYQQIAGAYKPYLSLKFRSDQVPLMPEPVPFSEIFVYSPVMEGIHLRSGIVARGGIRWSDRHEDYRTEILGLMKAQHVKNAVIVPSGAKGGFIVKHDLKLVNCLQARSELILECYKSFISGLLDLVDNRVKSKIVSPKQTICLDDPDPYLVVAADKGTATFSDTANELAKQYGYWLDDAFASGGSAGYDHKRMGITARGAWESVKLHFRKYGVDVQAQPINIIGIGDMGGDVFGNGMLCSQHIRLLAAFNHLHIFIDPNPDASTSFTERQRVYNLPRSSWEDYDKALISPGGGLFSRQLKSVDISPEIKAVFNIPVDKLMPDELIQYILKAKVDLFFNGGIGTFVKATHERHDDVCDRDNDAIRINGRDLGAKVACEGGNLGFTQLGRIEYALAGGVVNTDAIDNSAGVNCSDNEVNIKVLLTHATAEGELTQKQRDALLFEMTDEVADIVLQNNRSQNDALTVAEFYAKDNIDMHYRLLQDLEKHAGLQREVEFLPDAETIARRKASQQGFTRPELAILLGYTKIQLKQQLIDSDLPEDPFVAAELSRAFPTPIRQKFARLLPHHRLCREIIVTQVANLVVNEMGVNFINRLFEETGAPSVEIVRAYLVSKAIFQAAQTRHLIQGAIPTIGLELAIKLVYDLNRLIRRGTRWFLRNRRGGFDIQNEIEFFAPRLSYIRDNLEGLVRGVTQETLCQTRDTLLASQVPRVLACQVAAMEPMLSSLDIVEAAVHHDLQIGQVAATYFCIGGKLELGWFRQIIKRQTIINHWEAMARGAFRDDVDRQQRNLTVGILVGSQLGDQDIDAYVDNWLAKHSILVERWQFFLTELKNSNPQFTMFAVALRELMDLSQAISFPKLAKQ